MRLERRTDTCRANQDEKRLLGADCIPLFPELGLSQSKVGWLPDAPGIRHASRQTAFPARIGCKDSFHNHSGNAQPGSPALHVSFESVPAATIPFRSADYTVTATAHIPG